MCVYVLDFIGEIQPDIYFTRILIIMLSVFKISAACSNINQYFVIVNSTYAKNVTTVKLIFYPDLRAERALTKMTFSSKKSMYA